MAARGQGNRIRLPERRSLPEEELSRNAALYVATEDGSAGTKGNVLDAVRENRLEADAIFACGPAPMLRALKAYAAEEGIDCYLSLEERMACGIGACLACVLHLQGCGRPYEREK